LNVTNVLVLSPEGRCGSFERISQQAASVTDYSLLKFSVDLYDAELARKEQTEEADLSTGIVGAVLTKYRYRNKESDSMEMIKALLHTNLQFKEQTRDLAREAQKKLEKEEEAQSNQTNDSGSTNANCKQVYGIFLAQTKTRWLWPRLVILAAHMADRSRTRTASSRTRILLSLNR
jgi:hypothetical protein